ncbi:hypothetical protein CN217_19230 [Sinorhizobium meliloti]|uniref:hypothetical protein n=1 Tax=Rhizobium meliloti TaxID=382 RepID=UPI000FD4BDF4|nr:hypothetical protein [Sinorhizobium meliloti]RVH08678.1 hypothetical protein CN217_19230 [Sinorhizobium meliloti]
MPRFYYACDQAARPGRIGSAHIGLATHPGELGKDGSVEPGVVRINLFPFEPGRADWRYRRMAELALATWYGFRPMPVVETLIAFR